MQVRGSRQGWSLCPLPPLCVIQSPVIGGGKETGPQSQWLSHAVRKELSLGTDVGNGCQLTSSSLGGRFRGRRGGEALLDEQAGGSTQNLRAASQDRLSAFSRNDLKLAVCMILQHYHFFWRREEGQLSACVLWSDALSLASVNNAAHVLVRPCLHDRGRETLCRRLEVNLYHIYLHGRWGVVLGGCTSCKHAT